VVDVLDGGGGGRRADGRIHGETGGGGRERQGHVGGYEHVVCLHGSADEERCERDDGEAETANEVLVGECLEYVNIGGEFLFAFGPLWFGLH
jgi:hypothetical protein